MTEESRRVDIPREEGEEEVVPITPQVNEAKTKIEDLSDLFRGVGQPDTEDVTTVSEEDVFGEGGADMSDLFEVPDIPSKPAPKKHKLIRRTSKPYLPPTTLGGMR